MRMPPNYRPDDKECWVSYASMEGGMRMPPNRSLRLGGLTWENTCRYERSQQLGRNESRLFKGLLLRTPGQRLFRGLPRTLAVTGPLAEFR